jgi:hypothetical protein
MLSQRKSPIIGFAALAVSHWIEHQTGWSIKKFIRTARRCRAAAIPGMTDKLLSQRLKDLEADGLVERHVHAGPPVRVEYRLTEKGDALSTILLDLNRWALKWIDLPADH